MKKLMIAAAAAAMVGSGFAGDAPQVYDMTITVKTTQCSGKQGKDVCDGKVYYRSQVTKKIYGKFWGCECKTIACPDAYGDPEADNGFMFWVDKRAFHDAEMSWPKLQRVGKTGENVEGMFSLTLSDCATEADGSLTVKESVWLDGAGYGTAKIYCEDGASSTDSYIKSMSGNVVGTWDAASESFTSGCKYCGTEENCTVFNFCPTCGDVDDEADKAVVFGSFTLRYNSSNTKALAKGKYIDEAYKFNKYVTAEFACIEAEASGDDDEKTPAEVAQEQYTKAKEALAAAWATSNTTAAAYKDLADNKPDPTTPGKSTKGKELTAALKAANDAKSDADDALTAANKELTTAVGSDADLTALKKAQEDLAKRNDLIAQANKAIDEATVASEITALKADLKILTDGDSKNKTTKIEPGLYKESLADLEKAVTNARAKCTDAAALAKYDAAYTKVESAKKDVNDAKQDVDDATDAIKTWFEGAVDKDGSYKKALKEADDAKDNAEKAVGTAEQNLKYAEIACTASGTVCK